MIAKVGDLTMMLATLMGFWLLLNGSMAPDVIVVGLVTALVITLLFRRGLSVVSEFRFTSQALLVAPVYVAYFLGELVKSNLRLAGIVLTPALPLRPGIVKARTRLKSPMGRLLLANSISLTPGTLTVEMEGEWLYIHWVTVEAEEVEAATARIVSGFEHYLEIMYG